MKRDENLAGTNYGSLIPDTFSRIASEDSRLLRINNLNLQPFADDFGVTQQRVNCRVFVGDVFQLGQRRAIHAGSLVDVGQA